MSYSDIYVCLDCHGIIAGAEYEEDMDCPFCGNNTIVLSRSKEEMEEEFDDDIDSDKDENADQNLEDI